MHFIILFYAFYFASSLIILEPEVRGKEAIYATFLFVISGIESNRFDEITKFDSAKFKISHHLLQMHPGKPVWRLYSVPFPR